MFSTFNDNDKKKQEKRKRLFCLPITVWMYVVLLLFMFATIILCIRSLIDYGFTLDSIPNFILVILLLVVSIVIVFAITTEWKPFIMPLLELMLSLIVLTLIIFFFRIYVFVRDGEKVTVLVWPIITYTSILGLYAFAFFIIMNWKIYIRKGN